MGLETLEFPFSSKARTLEQLVETGLSARVPDFLAFDLMRWQTNPDALLSDINGRFRGTGRHVAIRSSRTIEDSREASCAGQFLSILGIDPANRAMVRDAICRVIASYSQDCFPPVTETDQVLVQDMVEEVEVSGVIMTRAVMDGSPYYVIEYDDQSGKTDTVTGGLGVAKKVVVHHDIAESRLESARLRRMVRLAREVEGHCGRLPLDIEFAFDKHGQDYVFQVRPMAMKSQWRRDVVAHVNTGLPRAARFLEERFAPTAGVLGESGILGNMTDWNPAEMIGPLPRPLAASLYRKLVTYGTWRDARHAQGYRFVPDNDLMVLVEGHAFIDVRLSLNSFLPDGLEDEMGAPLIDAQLARLRNQPELHDKVEFEVCASVADFCWRADLLDRYPGVLASNQVSHLDATLTRLTNTLLDGRKTGLLAGAEHRIEALDLHLDQNYSQDIASFPGLCRLSCVDRLLTLCRTQGTRPFAELARHAFAAEALWRSAVRRGAIQDDRLATLKASIRSIAGEMMDDLAAATGDPSHHPAFLRRYGHLRPGAYDILSPRYDAQPALLFDSAPPPRDEGPPFRLTAAETSALQALLTEVGLAVSPEALVDYAARAIAGREYGKFVFTRALSDALEHLRHWGASVGLDAETLSFLDIETILTLRLSSSATEVGLLTDLATRNREDWDRARSLYLSYILRQPSDLYVAPLYRAQPTFITTRRLTCPSVFLRPQRTEPVSLQGKIVCIEQADPGFDWIFTKGIAGLITQYGGSNSHMAVRCAEFNLPAAIGCGEVLFQQAVVARSLELDCAHGKITPLGPQHEGWCCSCHGSV